MRLKPETIEKYLQFSNYPNKLKELVQSLYVSVEKVNKQKHFPGDSKDRIVMLIQIKRVIDEQENTIKFPYAISINESDIFENDPETIYNELLYGILVAIGYDIKLPTKFLKFCEAVDLSEESILAKRLFEKSQRQQFNLKCIFHDEEFKFMPK